MSDGNNPLLQGHGESNHLSVPDPVPPLNNAFWHKLWQVLKTVQARLRFVAILAIVGATIVYWDTLKAHYEKWTRPFFGEEAAATTDTEFWCPMHPTIVRDHPDKCPICGMPLSKRKKLEGGTAEEALPPGVVSRV